MKKRYLTPALLFFATAQSAEQELPKKDYNSKLYNEWTQEDTHNDPEVTGSPIDKVVEAALFARLSENNRKSGTPISQEAINAVLETLNQENKKPNESFLKQPNN